MILHDEKKFSIPKSFISKFVVPVVYELHPSLLVYNPDKKGKTFPRSRSVLSYFNLLIEGETVQVRYAQDSRIRKSGAFAEKEYTPEMLTFGPRGQIILDPSVPMHVEQHYFLSEHPRNESSHNFDKSKDPLFFLVDNQKTAIKEIRKETAIFEAKKLILQDWPSVTGKLKEVAKTLGELGVDRLSNEEVQVRLMALMGHDPEAFLVKCNDSDATIRSQITHGVELGLLNYSEKDMEWKWGVAIDDKETKICSVRPGEDPRDRVIKFLRSSLEDDNMEYFLGRLKDVISSKEPKKEKEKETVNLGKKKLQNA